MRRDWHKMLKIFFRLHKRTKNQKDIRYEFQLHDLNTHTRIQKRKETSSLMNPYINTWKNCSFKSKGWRNRLPSRWTLQVSWWNKHCSFILLCFYMQSWCSVWACKCSTVDKFVHHCKCNAFKQFVYTAFLLIKNLYYKNFPTPNSIFKTFL
jgi:hypothetical protein